MSPLVKLIFIFLLINLFASSFPTNLKKELSFSFLTVSKNSFCMTVLPKSRLKSCNLWYKVLNSIKFLSISFSISSNEIFFSRLLGGAGSWLKLGKKGFTWGSSLAHYYQKTLHFCSLLRFLSRIYLHHYFCFGVLFWKKV